MPYPLQIIQMDCSPLVIDNGYHVVQPDVLAQWVAQLLLGNSLHIARIIEGLDSKGVSLRNAAIDSIINKLNTAGVYKRDGWLFQMISWIALKINLHSQYGIGKVFMNAPHTAPAQHGIDGFALVIDDKKMIKYVVLCEDKCTEGARDLITTQIYPEFKKFENGEFDNRVLSEISSMIRGEDEGVLLQNIQDDIVENKYWVYRIGVTRQDDSDDEEGRKALYKGYDNVVCGDVTRRDAASVNLNDVRKWMDAFSKMVVMELEAKKQRMFNCVTANSLKTLPPVEGVDSERIPQILTKVYAHIVGLKTKYEVGVLNFEPKEIEEDCRLLGDLAFTLELYLESGKFAEKNDAIAFVAAMSHKLLGKLKEQEQIQLTFYEVSPNLVAILLFVIGGYIADAEELSYEIRKGNQESDAVWRLKQNIIMLVRGKLLKIVKSSSAKIDDSTIENYAQDLLWNHLSEGIKALAARLLGEDAKDYTSYFQRVLELSVFVDEKTSIKYDFVGVSRLARLLLMASKVLEEQSVLKVVNKYVMSTEHHDLLLHIVYDRPYLWRNHIDAIEKGVLEEGKSSVVTFPTGAGKSTLVELKIIQHVAYGGKVIYIVPTHALEYQVKINMSRLLGLEPYKDLNIGKEFTTEIEDELPVLVMTPERCSTLLALNPTAFEDTTLVMMDEFHIIGEDGHRSLGAMYCIVSLLSLLPRADFVLVSAMVENGEEIAGWIKDATNRDCLNLSMAWKPTSQLQGCIVYPLDKRNELQQLADEEKKNNKKRKTPSAGLKRKLLANPFCLFSLCNTWESNDRNDYYLTPILDHQVQLGVNNFWALNGNKNQVAKELAKKFAAIEMKTIVFVENPLQSNSLVKQLNTETKVEQLPADLQKKKNSIVEELGDVLCSYLNDEMGAVPHHSLLLPEERHVMEALFRGKSNIMIATPTLAQGVNLPVDVVLIAGEDRYDAETKGRDRMDAHEILNAAGRAGRAGFRSQGAAILVSNKVIGIRENTLTKDWFDLKNEIFSKGDQCLKIEDPFGKLAESTVVDEEMSTEQKMVLMKLNLLGENEKKVLAKSFYAYQLKRDQKDASAFEERIMKLSSLYEGEEGTPLMELSLKTGVNVQLLESFYTWLSNIEQDDDYSSYSIEFVLRLYCHWLFQTPDSLRELLTYEQTLDMLLKLFGNEKGLDKKFINNLWKALRMYINGSTLKRISSILNEKPADNYLTATRKFVLKVIPELSYAFSVLAMVHIQYLKDIGWDDVVIPTNIKNFATYLKEGVTSDEMLKYKTKHHLMRVEAHRLFEILE